jgi:SAM-dependent methyltransferase
MASPRNAARELTERRVRHLPAARRLRFEIAFEALERFAGERTLKVLDAGCGEGLFAEAIARRHPDWEIVAADLDQTQLARGRASAERARISNVRFKRLDLTQDLGDSLYDAVCAIECLEEIPDDEEALRRMALALRPGGLLIAHVPEENWEPVLPGGDRTWRHEVRHGYSVDEIVAKCERPGLEAVRVTPTGRSTVWMAQDVANRLKRAGLKKRALAYPALTTAVRLERWGITWGKARALLVEARRA